MTGQATSAQLAGLLVGPSMKGERPDEIVGLAKTMRAHAVPLRHRRARSSTRAGPAAIAPAPFNVSTAAALVLAGAGVPVAKHGNRSVRAAAAALMCFEALGVGITAPPADCRAQPRTGRHRLLFAPAFHPAMKHAAPTRKELGLRTAFNLLGPADQSRLADTSNRRRAQTGADGAGGALAAHAGLRTGLGGPRRRRARRDLDHRVHEGLRGSCRHGAHLPRAPWRLRPQEDESSFHCRRRRAHEREDPARAAARSAGPRRDIVLLNAGAGLFVAGRVAQCARASPRRPRPWTADAHWARSTRWCASPTRTIRHERRDQRPARRPLWRPRVRASRMPLRACRAARSGASCPT